MKATVDLLTTALQRAIKTLDSIGATYKIIASDGAEYGTLTVEKDAKSKRATKYPFGSVRLYYIPFVQGMKPGDTVEVPVGNFDSRAIQSGINSWFVQNYGRGSCVTSVNMEKSAVLVLRVL